MKAVYPGTFDPITLGHIDIITKAQKIFGNVVIAVAKNNNKNSIFTPEERMDMVKRALYEFNIEAEVVIFEGLLVNFMEIVNSKIVVRGLRAISDFEYEFQMSCVNSRLNNNIETVFLPAKDDMHFVSSRMIRSVAELGGNISQFVPNCIVDIMKNFYAKS
jgi:pantetheine-phosphate adenylyltransferase